MARSVAPRFVKDAERSASCQLSDGADGHLSVPELCPDAPLTQKEAAALSQNDAQPFADADMPPPTMETREAVPTPDRVHQANAGGQTVHPVESACGQDAAILAAAMAEMTEGCGGKSLARAASAAAAQGPSAGHLGDEEGQAALGSRSTRLETAWPDKSSAPSAGPETSDDTISSTEVSHDPARSLFLLPGAGPGLVWMLGQVGIKTLDDLSRADAKVLSARLGIVGQILNVEAWISFAQERHTASGPECERD
ncbi:hypothetical protein [Pseudorhodobacter sp. MZDSW-24AT]|uniref:hypothetical protein n=1 Tax=Pseudorhodobacter sp. MZDSW-24AT TaxID=2052957 RepID=UPI0012FE7414|nr:hypothetical protein [Pseudorhodobacter sp. MZDSW-24AT]